MRGGFYFRFFTILLMLSGIIGCSHNSVSPVLQPVQPGSRDYVWTVDTIYTEFNVITGIWGSSPNDVWAVGDGGTAFDRLQHYDGNKWVPCLSYSKNIPLCGGRTLYGFATNDVWVGGQEIDVPGAGIWHYDGTRWSRSFLYAPEPDSFSFVEVLGIWGLRSNDVYACGVMGYSPLLAPQGTSQ